MPDEGNGRVTIAVLGEKLDSMLSAQLQANRRMDEVQRTQATVCQAIAVNNEKWANHHDEHDRHDKSHSELHNRERGALGGLSVISSAISGWLAAWWPK